MGIGLAVLVLAGVAQPAHAATPSTRWHGTFSSRLTMPAGSDAAGAWPLRNYYTYVPPALKPVGQRSLIVYLHGTTQTAVDAANSVLWNDLADEQGFVVAYPEEATSAESGSTDDGSSDTRGWAWGRAGFEGRGVGEQRTIVEITRAVARNYGVDPGRVFIGGASAGAIMATVLAATYPDVYSAVGSWAGCSYLCADSTGDAGYERMGTYARVVPHILFAGTADYLINPALSAEAITGIVGMNDLADDGKANGSVSRKPTSGPKTYNATLSALTPRPHPLKTDPKYGLAGTCLYDDGRGNNPCAAGVVGWKQYPYTVTKFAAKQAPRPVIVESWVIHGMSHGYGGGSTEGTFSDPFGPDTTRAAWRFFQAHNRS